jgi:predicted RNA-binding Zn ribbon-like protein
VSHEISRSGRFLWVGNDLSLDFVNTTPVLDGRPVDLLESFADLVDWLVEGGRLGESERAVLSRRVRRAAGNALFEDARAFRSALRSLFEAVVAGASPPAGTLAAVNRQLRRREAPEVRYERGAYVRAARPASLDAHALLLPVAEAAADLLTVRDVSLVRKCENPACVLFFYDTTKNHTRRWCSMAWCGNRHKVAAHYRRLRGK